MTAFRDLFFAAKDGLRLHARDYNEGETGKLPVLCLPGLTRNVRDFEDLAGYLADEGRRVIVAEQRGRGLSDYDPQPENYKPEIYVGDMLALLDHLALKQVIIIGTSLGGLMAMLMAAAQPARIAAILFNDIGPEVAPEGLEKIKRYVGRPPQVADWHAAAEDLRRIYAGAFPRYALQDWHEMARRLYHENAAGQPVLDYDPKIAVNVLNSKNAAPTLWEQFDAMPPIKLAVLRGSLSDILTSATLAEMRKRRSSLRVLELPEIGHAPSLGEEEARAFILEFLAGLP